MLRFMSVLWKLLLVTFVAGSVSVVLFVLQDAPIVEATGPPTAQDVATTRRLFRTLRRAANSDELADSHLSVDAAQLNSVFRLGARVIRGLRGNVVISADAVTGQISVPVPWWRRQKWLNVTASVPPFGEQLILDTFTVGHAKIPPSLGLNLARHAANIIVGDSFGDQVLTSVAFMDIADQTLTFTVLLDDMGKNGLMRSAFATMRGEENPDLERIDRYYVQIREGIDAGDLPASGSFMPHLRFTLQAALAHSTPETFKDEYTAAILALAKACGAKDFAMIVGGIVFDKSNARRIWTQDCREVRLNQRIDSRRHFVTAAALQAASNNAVAVSVGEFKELYDTISGAGGFDFTDIAANLSGIHLSDFLMSQSFDTWPGHLARITTERDVIVSFDDIPHLLPEADFKARFGDVDSPAYLEMTAEIEMSVKRLGLYSAK